MRVRGLAIRFRCMPSENRTDRSLLMIADIAGYTRLMLLHRLNLAHAQVIVSRLLEAVVESVPEMSLYELEGDAAFFCTPLDELEGDPTLLSQKMHRAFHGEQDKMNALNLCSCQPCKEIGRLRLKFVAHVGDVGRQQIAGRTHLAGVDVITVHRMLKNAVPVDEYLLTTERLNDEFAGAGAPAPATIEQELDGIGPATLRFTDMDEIALAPDPPPPATVSRRAGQLLSVAARGFPMVVGLRRPALQPDNM